MKKFYFTSLMAAAALSLSAAAPVEAPIESAHSAGLNAVVYNGEISKNLTTDRAFRNNVEANFEVVGNEVRTPKAGIIDEGDEDESEWQSLGMCTYTDDFVTSFFKVDCVTYQVEIQEKITQPGFFRLVNPYGEAYPYNEEGDYDENKHYMYIHAENPVGVYIEEHLTGTCWDPSYGDFCMWSLADYAVQSGQLTLDECIAEGMCGKYEDGVITFPEQSLLVALSAYNSGKYTYANNNGKFKIVMPGIVAKDYSVEVDNEMCGADNVVPFMVTFGADVAASEYVLLYGNFGINSANMEYLHENAEDMGVASLPVENDKVYSFTLNEPGKYTLFVMALDEEGNFKEGAGCYFYGTDFSNEGWTSLGNGQITDGIIAGFYNLEPETMVAEIQEATELPGYYRVVNPFAAHSLYEQQYHSTDHNHYIYINATMVDEETGATVVFVEESPIGMNIGEGDMVVNSIAARYIAAGKTVAETKEAGDYFGTITEDGVVTMPVKGLLVMEASDTSAWYYTNNNGDFQVVIPEGESGVSSVVVDNNAATEYFNLQGVRVAEPAQGLYIVRKGNEVSKVIR